MCVDWDEEDGGTFSSTDFDFLGRLESADIFLGGTTGVNSAGFVPGRGWGCEDVDTSFLLLLFSSTDFDLRECRDMLGVVVGRGGTGGGRGFTWLAGRCSKFELER